MKDSHKNAEGLSIFFSQLYMFLLTIAIPNSFKNNSLTPYYVLTQTIQFYPNKSQNLAEGNITHTHLTSVGIQSGNNSSSKETGESRDLQNRFLLPYPPCPSSWH